MEFGVRLSAPLRVNCATFGDHIVGVGSMVSEEQVVWSDARGVIAPMENQQSSGYWADVKLPRDTMRLFGATTEPEPAVAKFASATLPFPASAGFFNVGEESVFGRERTKRGICGASLFLALVVHVAHAELFTGTGAFVNGTGRLGKHLGFDLRGVMRQGVSAPLPPSIVSERAR